MVADSAVCMCVSLFGWNTGIVKKKKTKKKTLKGREVSPSQVEFYWGPIVNI